MHCLILGCPLDPFSFLMFAVGTIDGGALVIFSDFNCKIFGYCLSTLLIVFNRPSQGSSKLVACLDDLPGLTALLFV